MGVPSCGLCWLHNSGVSTPSLFSQSKNTLGLTLNQLEISFPRPNLNAIFFPLPLPPPNLHTDSYITAIVDNVVLPGSYTLFYDANGHAAASPAITRSAPFRTCAK